MGAAETGEAGLKPGGGAETREAGLKPERRGSRAPAQVMTSLYLPLYEV